MDFGGSALLRTLAVSGTHGPMAHALFSAQSKANKLLVWLGPPFFAPRLPELGWELIRADHDVTCPRTWNDILTLTGGATPAVLVTADASIPPPVTGMEAFPCLTIFYAIDSHIHSWYPLYGQGFDLCLVSLRDHLPLFAKGRLTSETVRWSPAYALNEHRPPSASPAMEWDLLFVGTVDQQRAPERYLFLTEAKARFPGLHITRGNFVALYPRAKLVLNECTHGELNFRVFEALGCGACLLTPDIGPPLTEMFVDGKELFLYPQRDVPAMLRLARRLLDDDTLRQRAAKAGLAAVDAGHRASHRAAALDEWLSVLFTSGQAESLTQQRLEAAVTIHRNVLRLLYLLHAESIDHPQLRKSYLRAANQSPC